MREDLDYRVHAFRADEGTGLRLDAAYSVFHLPLVNAAHPDAVLHDPAIGIDHGRFREPRRSLVAFVSWDELDETSALSTSIERVRRASFSPKVAWDSFAARHDRLHVSIASLGGELDVERVRRCLPLIGPLELRVCGLWAGRIRNTGRLYLPCYPCSVAGERHNALQELQRMAELPVTRFFGIGILNLTDHLNPEEAQELVDITSASSVVEIARYRIRTLSIIDTYDSLLNDFTVIESFVATAS